MLLVFIGWCVFIQASMSAQTAAWASLEYIPERLYPDTLHAPFYLGVASAEPEKDGFLIWTHITTPEAAVVLEWQVADDPNMKNVIRSGSTPVFAQDDHTVRVQVNGLQSGRRYYYRFKDAAGRMSAVGRAQTAFSDDVPVRIATVSCSSIYSGFFNAYRQIALREDVHWVIHMGDYIYDYVDEDEPVRVPVPYPKRPKDLTEYRLRHQYYLLDPDLRAARQMHTWIFMFDNHDVDRHPEEAFLGSRRAFYEYAPFKSMNSHQPFQLYRKLNVSPLVEVFTTDMNTYVIPMGVDRTYLGKNQLEWLISGICASEATWKLMASQKMVAGWYSRELPGKRWIPGNGDVFDAQSFDGYPEEKVYLMQELRKHEVKNWVVASGDMHMTFVMHITEDPFDRSKFNRKTGEGSIGIEALTTSVSRGNVDEAGVPRAVIPLFKKILERANPHHVYTDLTRHGYGLWEFSAAEVKLEMWYCPILSFSDDHKFGRGYTSQSGSHVWRKKPYRQPQIGQYPP